MGFLSVLKMYHVRLFIVEKRGFGAAPRQCGIHYKPWPLLQKTCLSYTFETLAAYASLGPCMQATAHVRGPRAILVILFPKINFCSFKMLYFPF